MRRSTLQQTVERVGKLRVRAVYESLIIISSPAEIGSACLGMLFPLNKVIEYKSATPTQLKEVLQPVPKYSSESFKNNF